MPAQTTYELNIQLLLTDRASRGLRGFRDELRGTGDDARRHASAFDRLLSSQERIARAGDRIGDVWRRQTDSLRVYTDQAMELIRAQEKFKTIGLSGQDNERAFKAVAETVDQIKGAKLSDTTETITDLHTALGDLGHAIEALPIATKYRVSFETLFGDKFSHQQIEEQVQNAFKFLEVTGKVVKGREEMERSFNVMAQMTAATGGRVTPAELLLMARRAGPSLQNLNEGGLRNMSAVVQELGGSGAGTSLMSAYQALVGGTMRQSSANEFARLGLLNTNKVQFGRAQQIKHILPGGNLLGAPLMDDPLQAADMLMAAMKSHGVDTSNNKKVAEEIAILFQNRTAQRLMTLLTTQRAQVVKESNLSAGAKNIEQLNEQSLESPMRKLANFQAAMDNFRAQVGLPLVEVGTKLATAFTPYVELMGKHPDVTLFGVATLGVVKAMSGVLETGAALRQSGVLDLLFRRGAADADKFGAGVDGAAGKVAGLSGKLNALPSNIKIGIGVVAVGYALDKIWELYQAGKEVQEGNREALDASGQAASSFENLQRLYASLGKPVPRGMFRTAAAAQLEQLQMNGDLTDFLNPFGHPLRSASKSLLAYAPYEGAGGGIDAFRRRAPELVNPNVMTEFLRLIRGGAIEGISKEQNRNFESSMVAKAFPDTYKQAADALSQEMMNLSNPVRSLTDAYSAALGPVNQIPSSAGGASSALDTFAFKLNTQSIFPTQAAQPGVVVPSRAIGGIVERDGLAVVHAGNVIQPARVGRGNTPKMGEGKRLSIGSIQVHARTDDPAEIARMVASEVARQRELM